VKNCLSAEERDIRIHSMSKTLKIGWIGGGKMAQAMAKGIVSAGLFL
jgi:hypothetical protein